MQTLDRRLTALEQQTQPLPMQAIVIRFDEPGQPSAEIERLSMAGAAWQRQPGETERAFIDRALKAAPPTAAVRVLLSD